MPKRAWCSWICLINVKQWCSRRRWLKAPLHPQWPRSLELLIPLMGEIAFILVYTALSFSIKQGNQQPIVKAALYWVVLNIQSLFCTALLAQIW